MSTVEELKLRVRELENELIRCRQKCSGAEQPLREKITTMSAEVVDSNPYRYPTSGLTPPLQVHPHLV